MEDNQVERKKTALVFGATGQAGWYLCELLLRKGYEVYGTYRGPAYDIDTPPSEPKLIDDIRRKLPFGVLPIYCDFLIRGNVRTAIQAIRPLDEVYNMAGLLFAPDSWEDPAKYMFVNANAVIDILEAIRKEKKPPKFFQAGSVGMFDSYRMIDEESPINPKDPYHMSKAVAYQAVKMYRERYGLKCCTGIFSNMESVRRASIFFTRKVTIAAARLALATDEELKREKFGSLEAQRDWGLTEEYVEAAWLMLRQDMMKDYVIASGSTYSCKDFAWKAFQFAGGNIFGKLPDFIDYDLPRTSDFSTIRVSPFRIKIDLGWEAKTKDLDGIVSNLFNAAKEELEVVNG